jgi:hypothetical protein
LAYFKYYHQLHITTTNIRKLTETEADAMCDKGQITPVARKAVSNINGHSDTTVKNYYLKKKRRQDAHDSQQMFDVLSMGNPLSNDSWFAEDNSYENEQFNYYVKDNTIKSNAIISSNDCNVSSPQITNKREMQSPSQGECNANIAWGQDHPEYNSPKTRISWSDEENNYIRHWWKTIGSKCSTNVASKLLAHIKSDNFAIKIFHPNHTLDSARIRHGLRMNGFNK